MRLDIAAAPVTGIACRPVQGFLQRRRIAGKPRFHAIEHLAILQQYLHQSCQVIHAPIALHVGFACADRTAESNFAIEARIMHTQSRA